jgi:hypothetical protein
MGHLGAAAPAPSRQNVGVRDRSGSELAELLNARRVRLTTEPGSTSDTALRLLASWHENSPERTPHR